MIPKIQPITGPKILCRSGAYIDLESPDQSNFTIDDIAHGLSNICRFTGQCDRFYSVAEHSVHTSYIVRSEFAWDALLHDAAEAFIGDVAQPLKSILPDYKRIEARVECAVFDLLGVNNPLPDCVKKADLRMLATEQFQAMGNSDCWPSVQAIHPANLTLKFWDPATAKKRFLARFVELGGQL
jgi:hypothetical protein